MFMQPLQEALDGDLLVIDQPAAYAHVAIAEGTGWRPARVLALPLTT